MPSDTAQVHFSRSSIDLLFESVADAYGDPASAVVLSGTGFDGAGGLRTVKAKGGADIVLPLEETGPALAALVAPPAEGDDR